MFNLMFVVVFFVTVLMLQL